MNNYFGIGLDAKIAYEFHARREERLSQYMYVLAVCLSICRCLSLDRPSSQGQSKEQDALWLSWWQGAVL